MEKNAQKSSGIVNTRTLTKIICRNVLLKTVIYDSLNDILKEEANYFRQMLFFPSHPLPLNEDYSKEFFPNNIKN
jgi:hypothetical protein